LRRRAGDVHAVDLDRAGIAFRQAGDDAQDGALAAAAGSEQGHQLAVGDVEADALHDLALAEALLDVADLQGHATSLVRREAQASAGPVTKSVTEPR